MSLTHASTSVDADEQVVIRVVVYGPASAGKTTTARSLGENLGRPVETPEEEEDGTTVFFDWMEYEGGTFEGSAIRIQLVTVPGHDRSRRLALLDVADVIIFVADTTEAGINCSADYLREMLDELIQLKRDPALIVQANKRDDSTAVPIDAVRERFGMLLNDPLVETVATNGDGVRLVFVLAMRHGLKRHAARIAQGEVASRLDPDRLLEALRAVESSVPQSDPDLDSTSAEAPSSPFVPPPPPSPDDAIEPQPQGDKPKSSWLRKIFAG